MFVFDCPDDEGVRTVGVVCNPVLTLPEGKDRRLEDDDEGCLSFPGSFEPCPRPDWARVDGQGLDGTPVSFEGDGLLARCLQHETDHTLGTVFGDRLSSKSRKKLTKKHDAAAEDYPLSWPADDRRLTAMHELRITRENARFQQWEALLTNRSKRHRNREFLVQGVRPITRAVEEGWTVRALLRADGAASTWSDGLWSTDRRRTGAALPRAARPAQWSRGGGRAGRGRRDARRRRRAPRGLATAARSRRGLRPPHEPRQHRHPGPLGGRVRRLRPGGHRPRRRPLRPAGGARQHRVAVRPDGAACARPAPGRRARPRPRLPHRRHRRGGRSSSRTPTWRVGW